MGWFDFLTGDDEEEPTLPPVRPPTPPIRPPGPRYAVRDPWTQKFAGTGRGVSDVPGPVIRRDPREDIKAVRPVQFGDRVIMQQGALPAYTREQAPWLGVSEEALDKYRETIPQAPEMIPYPVQPITYDLQNIQRDPRGDGYIAEDTYTRAGQIAAGEDFNIWRNIGDAIQRQAAISDHIQEHGTDAEKLDDLGFWNLRRAGIKQLESFRSLGLGADNWLYDNVIGSDAPNRLENAMDRAKYEQEQEKEKYDKSTGVLTKAGDWLQTQQKFLFGVGDATEDDPKHGAAMEALQTAGFIPFIEETMERPIGQIKHVLDKLVPGDKAALEAAILANNLSEEDAEKARAQYNNWSNWNEELLGERPGRTDSLFGWNWPTKKGANNELAEWWVQGRLGGIEEFRELPIGWQLGLTVLPALMGGGPASAARLATRAGTLGKITNQAMKASRGFGKAYSTVFLDPAYWGSYLYLARKNANIVNRLGKHLFEPLKDTKGRLLNNSVVAKKLKQGAEEYLTESNWLGNIRKYVADLPIAKAADTPLVRATRAKAGRLINIVRLTDEARAGEIAGQASSTLMNWLQQAGRSGNEQMQFIEHLVKYDDADDVVRAAAREALGDMGFRSSEVPETVKKVWNLAGKEINQLDSVAGHMTRALLREMAGTAGKRQVLSNLMKVARKGTAEGADKVTIKAAQKAGEEVMQLLADGSAKVAGVSDDVTKTKKFLSSWQKAQGYYAKWFHMGPVPGLAIRNASVDFTTMLLNHNADVGGKAFHQRFGPTAAVKGFGSKQTGSTLKKVRGRDIELDDVRDASKLQKWTLQLGLSMTDAVEKMNARTIWAKGARNIMDRFWKSGVITDTVIDKYASALNISDEVIARLKSRVKYTMNPDELDEVLLEVLGKGVKWKRGDLPDKFVDELQRMYGDDSSNIVNEIRDILQRAEKSGDRDAFIAEIDNLKRKALDNASKKLTQTPQYAGEAASQVDDTTADFIAHMRKELGLDKSTQAKWEKIYHEKYSIDREDMKRSQILARFLTEQLPEGALKQQLRNELSNIASQQTNRGNQISKTLQEYIAAVKAGTHPDSGIKTADQLWQTYRDVQLRTWDEWQANSIDKLQDVIHQAAQEVDEVIYSKNGIHLASLKDEAWEVINKEKWPTPPLNKEIAQTDSILTNLRKQHGQITGEYQPLGTKSASFITFDNPVDEMLYLASKAKSGSKEQKEILEWLHRQYLRSDDEILEIAEKIKHHVNYIAKQYPGDHLTSTDKIVRTIANADEYAPRPATLDEVAEATAAAQAKGMEIENMADADVYRTLRNALGPVEARLYDRVKYTILQQWDELAGEVAEKIDHNVFRNLKQELQREMAGTKMLADRFGREMRDYSLHNYGRRYNFDTALSLPFGYPFWYTRTYAKWLVKMMGADPFASAAVYRFNNTMENWNRDLEEETGIKLPQHLKRALQIDNLPFGLEKFFGEHISVPLLKNFIPIQDMLDGQFRNTERLKNVVGNMYEGVYGFGLGSHALIPQILAAAHYMSPGEDNKKQALQYVGYMGSATRLGSSMSLALPDEIFPGGIGAEPALALLNMAQGLSTKNIPLAITNAASFFPMIKLMWKPRPGKLPVYVGTIYDQGRIDKTLSQMERDKLISHEVAVDAALIAGDPQRFLDEGQNTEFYENGAVEAWLTAVRKSRGEKGLKNAMSWLGGPAFVVRDKAALESQAMYEKVSELYAMSDDPNSDPDEVAMAWAEFKLSNPEFVVASMARRFGEDRIKNYTWDVLSRVGRGDHMNDIYRSFGLDYGLVQEWYNTKGNIRSKADRDRFETGILTLGFNLDNPSIPTGLQWKQAAIHRREIYETLDLIFPGTADLQEEFYDTDKADRPQFLEKYPEFAERQKEESRLIYSEKYKDTVAPYYKSYTHALRYLTAIHDAPFDEKYIMPPSADGKTRTVSAIYHKFITEARDAGWDDEQRLQFLKSIPGLQEYAKSWKEFKETKDESIELLGKHIPEPLFPTVRPDAPDFGEQSKQIQKAVKDMESEQPLLLTGFDKDQITDITDPAEWYALWQATEEINQVYFDNNQAQWLSRTLTPLLDSAKVTNATGWKTAKNDPLLATWPVSSKGSDGLIAYVRQQGAKGLRQAMMLETLNGVSKDTVAWRVIGTIQAMDAAEMRSLASSVPELHDIERVNWYALGEPKPTLDVLMKAMGFRASFDKKGKVVLKKEADIGPLLTDEEDRIISNPDIYKYIRNIAEAEGWGTDVDLLWQQHNGLMDSGQIAQAHNLWQSEPLLQAYDNLVDQIFARFNAAKAGPGSKKFIKFLAEVNAGKRPTDMDELMKLVMSGKPSQTSSAVSSAYRVSKARSPRKGSVLYDFHILKEKPVRQQRYESYQRQQRRAEQAEEEAPDLTAWTTVQAKLKAENPSILSALMDYFDLSAYAKPAHLQRNINFARWLAVIPAAQLAAIEQAYFLWAKQTGRLSPQREQRVSRSRPSLATTLRVYKPRSVRSGL